jgi:hypothetical protein
MATGSGTAPIVLSPDDAYTQFKTAEGTYTLVLSGQANAQAQLTAAQAAVTQSNSDLATAQANAKAAADALIASLQAFEQGLPTPGQL